MKYQRIRLIHYIEKFRLHMAENQLRLYEFIKIVN